MKAPATWEPHYRLNTCVDCGHYLHDGKCPAARCTCEDGVGRWASFAATRARTKTCKHGVRPSSNCVLCQRAGSVERTKKSRQRKHHRVAGLVKG